MQFIFCKKYKNINLLIIFLARYFIHELGFVVSNSRAVGYMSGSKVFEELIDLLEEKQGRVHTAARFRPTAERLSDIADGGQELLQNASDKDLAEFTE